MAPQPDGQHQRLQQTALMVAMGSAMRNAFGLYVPGEPGSVRKWILAVQSLVHRFGAASAASAATFYEDTRKGQVAGTHRTLIADPPPMEAVEKAMRWSISVTGTGPTADDLAAAETRAEGAATKLALDQGRNTLLDNIAADTKCRGWYREAKPGACSFCAMLAQRGAVYKSQQSAAFQAHDHDRCIPVPLFADFHEPAAYVREWQALWVSSTRGKSGPAAVKAFRQAYEGRTSVSG